MGGRDVGRKFYISDHGKASNLLAHRAQYAISLQWRLWR